MPIISPLFYDAEIFFLVFGFITLLGGIMGYVKARSTPSLIAGSVAGIFLIVGALLLPRTATWTVGAILDLLVSLLLLGRFTPSLIRGKLNPAVYVVPLSLIGAILAAYLLLSPGHP